MRLKKFIETLTEKLYLFGDIEVTATLKGAPQAYPIHEEDIEIQTCNMGEEAFIVIDAGDQECADYQYNLAKEITHEKKLRGLHND